MPPPTSSGSFPSSTFHIQGSLHAVNLAHSVNVKLNIFANGRLPTPGENLLGASRKCNFPLANDFRGNWPPHEGIPVKRNDLQVHTNKNLLFPSHARMRRFLRTPANVIVPYHLGFEGSTLHKMTMLVIFDGLSESSRYLENTTAGSWPKDSM
jgi:hypothetical protein